MITELMLKHHRLYELLNDAGVASIYRNIRFPAQNAGASSAAPNTKVRFYDFDMALSSSSGHDRALLKYHSSQQSYEPELSDFLIKNIRIQDLFIDVGANNGYFSLLASKRCKKVYAFEPQKDSYERMLNNITLNGLSNVVTYQFALGSKEETKELYLSKKEDGLNTFVNTDDAKSKEAVSVKKLDDVIKDTDFKSVFLKMDVEGYEREVIEGASEFIKQCKPTVIFEFNYGILYRKNRHYNEVFDALTTLGYSKFTDLSNGSTVSNYRELKTMLTNVIAN